MLLCRRRGLDQVFGDGHVRGGMPVPVAVVEGCYLVGVEEEVITAFVVDVDCTGGFWSHL